MRTNAFAGAMLVFVVSWSTTFRKFDTWVSFSGRAKMAARHCSAACREVVST